MSHADFAEQELPPEGQDASSTQLQQNQDALRELQRHCDLQLVRIEHLETELRSVYTQLASADVSGDNLITEIDDLKSSLIRMTAERNHLRRHVRTLFAVTLDIYNNVMEGYEGEDLTRFRFVDQVAQVLTGDEPDE